MFLKSVDEWREQFWVTELLPLKRFYRETKKLEFLLSAQTLHSSFQVILDILLSSGLILRHNLFLFV